MTNLHRGTASVTVEILRHGTVHEVNTYWKYGRTSDDLQPHWYEFLFDGTTGAEIFGDRILIHLVDGQRGDDDLTVNGQILDPADLVSGAQPQCRASWSWAVRVASPSRWLPADCRRTTRTLSGCCLQPQ